MATVVGIVILVGWCGAASLYRTIVQRTTEHPVGDFQPRNVIAAANWIGENARPDEVVLACPGSASDLPRRVGVTVLACHWAQMLDAQAKQQFIRSLFQPGSALTPETVRQTLDRNRVRYIVLDRYSAGSLGLPDMEQKFIFEPMAKRVFANPDAVVWKVAPLENSTVQ